MLLLEKSQKNQILSKHLSKGEIVSLLYHSIFNYPLTTAELIRWTVGEKSLKIFQNEKIYQSTSKISQKDDFLYFGAQIALVFQRLLRKRISDRKKSIAQKASRILDFIPTIKFIGLTGALAMDNSDENSDIDFLIIVKKGTLWTTRLLTYLVLKLAGFKFRCYEKNPLAEKQKDKICLNMWLDETSMVWRRRRDLFTAHEIAQINTLINKDKTYEKLISKNKWVKDFWPNAIKVQSGKWKMQRENFLCVLFFVLCSIFEPLAYKLQRLYMRGKVTKEVVACHQAIFHPFNWDEVVSARLNCLLS